MSSWRNFYRCFTCDLRFAAATDREKLGLDGEAVLKSIEAQHGLLVKQAWGAYSFSHLTLQEYLTARELASSRQRQGLEKLVSHLTDSRWREVFLLVSEMTTPADDLLRLMKKKIDEIAHDSYLQEFLTEVNNKSHSAHIPYQYRSRSKDTSKSFRAAYRAFYLSSVLDLDLTLERAFWDVDSLSFGHILDYASGISIPFSDIYYFREYSLASSIISAFPRIRESAYSPISALEVARIFEPVIADKLLELLKPVKEQINYQKRLGEKEKTIGEWWKANGQTWTKQLKDVTRFEGCSCHARFLPSLASVLHLPSSVVSPLPVTPHPLKQINRFPSLLLLPRILPYTRS